eukprot:11235663-Alexandrium_andersonii.AAC.1
MRASARARADTHVHARECLARAYMRTPASVASMCAHARERARQGQIALACKGTVAVPWHATAQSPTCAQVSEQTRMPASTRALANVRASMHLRALQISRRCGCR